MTAFGMTAVRLCAVTASVVLISACSQPQGAALLQRAQSSMEAGDYRAAAIDLKNLLRAEPDNAQARLALGELMIRGGDARGGVRELRQARELGAVSADLELWLARGLMSVGELEQVLSDTAPEAVTDPAKKRELFQIRGDALLGLQRHAEARAEFQAALKLEPRDVRSIVGLGSAAMSTEGFEAAQRHIDEALKIAPEDPLAWRMLGAFLLRDRRFAEARDTFEKAVGFAERAGQETARAGALTGLIEAQLALGDIEAAEATTARLVEIAPFSTDVVYLQARTAFLRGDYDSARRGLEQLIAQDPRDQAARLLLGAVSYVEGNLGQADMYLASVVASEPGNSFARKLLADTRIRQMRPKDAKDAPKPAGHQGGAGALPIAGKASIAAGDLDAGLAYLEQGEALKPEDAAFTLQLAAGYLAAGRADRAVDVLKRVDSGGDDAYRRELLLLVARIRADDQRTALKQARGFAAAHPNDGLAQSLAGGLALEAGDRAMARTYFERAVQLGPKNAAAVLNLGKLELVEGRLDVAEQRFKSALELEPAHPAVLVAMAQLSVAKGDTAGAVRWLEQARSQNPRSVEPRVLLGQYYLSQRRFAEAYRIALEANQLAPEDPAAVNVLSVALTASGQTADGVRAFEDLSRRNPQSAPYRLGLARAYLAAGRANDALASARQAVQLNERYLPALALLAGLHLEREELKEAEQLVGRMRQIDASSPMTQIVEGDLAMRARRFAAAAAAYQAASQQAPSRALVTREFLARHHGRLEKPTQPLEQWLAAHPEDSAVRMILAESLLGSGRVDEARRQYELIVASDPLQATALNNLAWLQLGAGDARAAVRTAESAFRLQPGLADIVDTYGWALYKSGENALALEHLRKAHGLAPRSAEIRYHLAAALADGGQVDEAREHLRELAARSDAFPSRGEASKLLERLGGDG